MNYWQRYSQNLVYKWTVSPVLCPVSTGFGNVMFGKSYTHSCSVFVWLFSDERRSVQPSNQVHWSLHWPSQHLHRNGVLSQRQPAGNLLLLFFICWGWGKDKTREERVQWYQQVWKAVAILTNVMWKFPETLQRSRRHPFSSTSEIKSVLF